MSNPEPKKKKKGLLKNFDRNKFLIGMGVKFFKNRAMHDPKFLSGIMTKILNPYFARITPKDFIDGYEQKIPLMSQVVPQYGKIGMYAEKFNLKKSEMKEVYEKYMPEFKIDWIYVWFRKDHPILYATLVNYPDRQGMENYVVHQIHKVSEDFLNNVLH